MHLFAILGPAAAIPSVDGVYRLAPEQLARARALSHDFTALHFAGTIWSVLKLVLLLRSGLVARFRDAAVKLSRAIPLQAAIFFFLLLLTSTLLSLPLRWYGHHLLVSFGLSVQPTASWLADAVRSFGLTWAGAILLGLLLWVCLRYSRRLWWLSFALAMMPVVAAAIFASPVLIDPIFDRFDPLQATHPELVRQLEQVVVRSGTSIPPDRMFLMHASDKWTGLNAYVTGFGASKRVVVWDTTIAMATPPEIQMIFAHEMGHYVLHHLVRGYVEACVGLLLGLWLAYHLSGWLMRRFAMRWRLRPDRAASPDWGVFGVLLLTFALLSIPAEPVENFLSRQIEHEADVYGQEAMHGIVADPRQVAAEDFQKLGESDLDLPEPNPLIEFWTSSHPSISERKAFAAHYDPWAPGQTPRFFPR